MSQNVIYDLSIKGTTRHTLPINPFLYIDYVKYEYKKLSIDLDFESEEKNEF